MASNEIKHAKDRITCKIVQCIALVKPRHSESYYDAALIAAAVTPYHSNASRFTKNYIYYVSLV